MKLQSIVAANHAYHCKKYPNQNFEMGSRNTTRLFKVGSRHFLIVTKADYIYWQGKKIAQIVFLLFNDFALKYFCFALHIEYKLRILFEIYFLKYFLIVFYILFWKLYRHIKT